MPATLGSPTRLNRCSVCGHEIPPGKEIALGDLVEIGAKAFKGQLEKYNGAEGTVVRISTAGKAKVALVEFIDAPKKYLDAQFISAKDLVVIPKHEIYGEND